MHGGPDPVYIAKNWNLDLLLLMSRSMVDVQKAMTPKEEQQQEHAEVSPNMMFDMIGARRY